MLPIEQWFRPKTQYGLAKIGDFTRHVIIGEPVLGGVIGVYYEISDALHCQLTEEGLLEIHAAADKEFDARVERNETHGEGSLYEVFRWVPTFTTKEAISAS